jgi:hypothetical protein
MSLLLPEMPKELLDWDGERRIIMFPWDAPVRMVPFGPDKTPWGDEHDWHKEPLETTTLCCKDTGAFGSLYMNLVVNRELNTDTEHLSKPNMHLNGYDDMYLDVHFGVCYPLDDETPKNAILDPKNYWKKGHWPEEEDGEPVPPEDPRIPRWARPWNDVTNGGFPIPEYLINHIAAQLAYKKHRVLSPLMHRWDNVHTQVVNLVRGKNYPDAVYKKIADPIVDMFMTFEHPGIDRERGRGTHDGINHVPILLPRTVSGLRAMLTELNRILETHAPKNLVVSIDVEKTTEGLRDFGAPHRTHTREGERLATLIRRMQTGCPLDVVEEGFSCAEDLYNWAIKNKEHASFPNELLRDMAWLIFSKHEKTYPSKKELEAEKRKATNLAQTLTRNMSDEDVARWFDEQAEKSKDPDFADLSVVDRSDHAANDDVRKKAGLMPVMIMDMDAPERMICYDRYGLSQMPNGKSVLQPVADAYIKVLVARRNRGIASRTARAEYNAAWLATRPDAWPLPPPGPIRGPWPHPQPASGASHSDHVDAADIAAQTARNKEEAAKQREVRRQAEAAAAAKQPRAYTAAGPSHREGAAKWEDEVPDACDKAKSDANREASKEAKAKRRAEKKAAKRADVEHRVWQFAQVRTGEAIGGNK